MCIALAAASAFQQDVFLVVLGNFHEELIRFCIPGDGAQRYIQDHVIPAGAGFIVFAAPLPGLCANVLFVLELQQGPKIPVPPKDNMPSTAAVATIRPPLGYSLCPVEMPRTRSPVTGSQVNLYVVNEICLCHTRVPTASPSACALFIRFEVPSNDGIDLRGDLLRREAAIDAVGKPEVVVKVEDRRGVVDEVLETCTDHVLL